jgi:hypothetical protein
MIFGGIIGFIFFLFELESPTMGGILFRVNSDGVKEFSTGSLVNMILAPLKYINFWTDINLWSVNWIITTFIGGFIEFVSYRIFV